MQVACVLITHLPMKAELQRYPELRGRPAIIIITSSGSRQRVLDSTPEARGVVAGMDLQEAVAHSKDAALLEADGPYYERAFAGILHSLEQRSPLVEPAGLGCVLQPRRVGDCTLPVKDCAYVALDGLEAMYGGEARLIASMLQAVPQAFNPRMGVAAGKFPAYVAAVTSPGGRATRVPQDTAGFLEGLSVDLLPLSWESKVRLRQFGLHTLGQVAQLGVGPAQAQLGTEGRLAWELAQGIDRRPLVPRQAEQLVSEALTFPSPTITHAAILTGLESLLSRAFARPEVRGRYVRSVLVEGQVLRRPPWVRQFPFKDAVCSKDRALFVIKNALESVALAGPLEDLMLTLVGLTGETGAQASLFSEVRQHEQLREAVRQLETRLGGKPPIYQVRDLEPWSRIPERRQALIRFDP